MANITFSWLLAKSDGLSSTLAACPDYFTPAFRPAHFGRTIFNTIYLTANRPVSGVSAVRPAVVNALDKRAERNELSRAIKERLCSVSDSPLLESYLRSLDCTGHIEVHSDGSGGVKMKTRFCDARWCLVCSGIRTAEWLSKYGDVVRGLAEVQPFYFVTLTRPNVVASDLPSELSYYSGWLRSVVNGENAKGKKGLPFVACSGIRAIECTYNSSRDDYHPHMHILVHGKDAAEFLYSRWLLDNSTAVSYASDFRVVGSTNKDLLEVCKYSVKPIDAGSVFNAAAVDWMYQCFKGMRTRQAFGSLYGVVNDTSACDAVAAPAVGIWQDSYYWSECDWLSNSGVVLVGRESSEKTKVFVAAVSAGTGLDVSTLDAAASVSLDEIRAKLKRVDDCALLGSAGRVRSVVLRAVGSNVQELNE